MKLDDNLRVIRLMDAYGKLLTDKQQTIMTNYYFDNLTLSEIGDIMGVSRQAILDTINKSVNLLEHFENCVGVLLKIDNATEKLNTLKTKVDSSNANLIETIIDIIRG